MLLIFVNVFARILSFGSLPMRRPFGVVKRFGPLFLASVCFEFSLIVAVSHE
jgi:hypothetical protein